MLDKHTHTHASDHIPFSSHRFTFLPVVRSSSLRLQRRAGGPVERVVAVTCGFQFTAVLTPAEEGGYIALNPETGTTTQGETVEEAVANLREATALYLEEFPMVSRGHPLVTTFSIPAHA